MAALMKLSRPPAFSLFPSPKPSSKLLYTTLSFGLSSSSPPALVSARPPASLHRRKRGLFVVSAIGKLSETELVSIPEGSDELRSTFPSSPGIYGVYDKNGDLQFIGVTRNVAANIATHRKRVPDLCSSVKVGLVEEAAADRATLTNAWKSWMEEHIAATGKIPPGNETGNETFVRLPTQKPDIRLTPGRQVQLTVPLEELIDRLVKEKEVVAFIKGSRSSPLCGFSQKVVGILQSHGVDFECVDVLDEEHNYGLREKLKTYSNWPTFPQVFVKGEFVGGCDIISSMAEKGELASLFQK
ncbi:hypothetical protein J5N97_002256 [Dioscorea zingiberensis]|uniref:Glutaredoxin domain-containing protein n=1 Tax=Dioscorea zingiberensis TaxID=325984 RepID=A0A9D5D1W0_9LILI|nr:hypothetical protein J5N97_002256 [Dioscorea zingiberensis]